MGNSKDRRVWAKAKLVIAGGILGGIIVLLFNLAVKTFAYDPFDDENLYLDYGLSGLCYNDSIDIESYKLLESLKVKQLIITPQEYTSHLGSYYQSLIAVLVCLFIVFSLVSMYIVKGVAQNEAREAQLDLDKREVQINSKVATNIKDSLREVLSDSVNMQSVIQQTIRGMTEDILKDETNKIPEMKSFIAIQDKIDKVEKDLNTSIETILEMISEVSSKDSYVDNKD